MYSIEGVGAYVEGLGLCSSTPSDECRPYNVVDDLENLDSEIGRLIDSTVDNIGVCQQAQVEGGSPFFSRLYHRKTIKLEAFDRMDQEQSMQIRKIEDLRGGSGLLSFGTAKKPSKDDCDALILIAEANLEALVDQKRLLEEEVTLIEELEELISRGLESRDYEYIEVILNSPLSARTFGNECHHHMIADIKRMKNMRDRQLESYEYLKSLDESRLKVRALLSTLVSMFWK